MAAAIAIAAPAAQSAEPDLTTSSPPPIVMEHREYDSYRQVVERTQAMVSDSEARRLVGAFGLDILNVTWEDTGRFLQLCRGAQHQRYDYPGAAAGSY